MEGVLHSAAAPHRQASPGEAAILGILDRFRRLCLASFVEEEAEPFVRLSKGKHKSQIANQLSASNSLAHHFSSFAHWTLTNQHNAFEGMKVNTRGVKPRAKPFIPSR